MANTHLNHKDFREEDIVSNGIVNEDNLDILDNQINDMACYDKVGSAYYKISKNMVTLI